ncbi:MAG: hypothetical protein QOD06_511, partial [Candidatus Binatota bacterium]|nr:hypothetical protein [Candidatus Binatota bacterium]
DLHWADRPSLLLLQFFAREIAATRLLVIGSYRHTELRRGHPLAAVLGELTLGSRLLLRGLGEQEIAEFLTARTGHQPPAAVTSAVARETGGNPFFLSEVARLLATDRDVRDAGSWTTQIPQGVREVVGRRLDRLSEETNRVLAVASVIGREFTLDVLVRVSGLPSERVSAALDEAVAAEILAAVAAAGRYAFSHALIHETLYEELPPARKATLHQRVGEALEERHRGNIEPHLSEVALHFYRAASPGDAGKAIDVLRRAARAAEAILGYEDAARQYERALELIELEPRIEERERCELLLALACAQGRSGDGRRARKSFFEAARVAKRLDASDLLAEAALGAGLDLGGDLEGIATVGHADEVLVELLREALDALPQEGSLRARLLARLAAALYWSDAREERTELARDAIEMASCAGDDAARVAVLNCARYALLGPGGVEERLRSSTEMLRLARDVGDRQRMLEALRWRVMDLLELGDLAGADLDVDAHTRLSEEIRQPFSIWLSVAWKAMRALLEGRYRAGEELAQEAMAIGQRTQNPHATSFFGAQVFRPWVEQGNLAAVEAAVGGILDQAPAVHGVRCALAFALAELGRPDEARLELERLGARGFRDINRDAVWLVSMTFLAEAAARIGDTERAATLYDLLAPHAALGVVVGPPPVAWYGPVAHYLGCLASTLGRTEEAEVHFQRAIERSLAMGSRPWLAQSELEYARMLDRIGRSDEARERQNRALDIARALGMSRLLDRAAPLAERTPQALHVLPSSFRLVGDSWSISYDGRTLRVRDAKGVAYIARLLRHPGQEFHVADLAGTGDGEAPVRLGDAGAILDDRARAAYRARLDELRAELEEAERWSDGGRIERLRGEIDILTAQLASAYGLGGRPRRAADDVERVRKAVTNRIRDAIVRLRKAHPPLGQHLQNAVRTGTFCRYAPEKPIAWDA